MLLCQRDADLYCMSRVVAIIPQVNPIARLEVVCAERKATQKMRIKQPMKVSSIAELLLDKECIILDKGGCNEYSANGQANCFNSSAPFVL